MLDLQDKVILVSKRKVSNSGEESFDTYFGTVETFNDNTVVVVKADETKEGIPYGEDFFDEAEEGFYELDDGSTCEDPDFIAEFLVWESEEAKANYKELNPE
jgi:hypothetical protein